jgi:hypothetical protein
MSRQQDHALIEERGWRARPCRKGAVALVGVALVALVAVTTGSTNAPTAGPYLYWANSKTTIARARLDGTGFEQRFLSGTGRSPCGVALDREHIYWGEALGGKVGSPDKGGAIGRANRDGSGVNAEFIPTPLHHGCGVAIAGNHIYWTSTACWLSPRPRAGRELLVVAYEPCGDREGERGRHRRR